MLQFITRRLFTLIPLLLAVSMLTSLLMYISPGDVLTQARAAPDVPNSYIEQMERQLGLVDSEGKSTPWYTQYGRWLANVSPIKVGIFTGDEETTISIGAPYLGESWRYKVPVLDLLMQRALATFLLSLSSITFAWCIAIPLGVLAAIYKDSIFDRLAGLLAYAALSVPEFLLAILAVYIAAVTGLFPVGGRSSVDSEFMSAPAQFIDLLYHLILPTIVLGIGSVAGMMRILRANFIDYVRAEFVTTGRAKGLTETVIMFKHVLRNAINPLITSLGFAFSSLLSGALLVENVMNYPGLGQLIYDSILNEDQFVVMAAIVLSVTMLVLGNLLADILLAWSDPRIRLEGDSGSSSSVSTNQVIQISGFFLLLIALEIGLEIAGPHILTLFAIAGHYMGYELMPSDVSAALWNAAFWIGVTLVTILATGCLAMVTYVTLTLIQRLARPLLSRPLGMTAAVILILLYGAAFLAPFLSPYNINKQDLQKPYHPPTALTWTSDGLAVQVYERVKKPIPEYTPVEGKSIQIKFFSEGSEYNFLGTLPHPFQAKKTIELLPMKLKFFQLDTEDPDYSADSRIFLLGSDKTGRDVFSRLLYGSRISLSIGLIGISITLALGFLVGGLAGYYGGTIDFVLMRLVEFLMSVPSLYLLLALRSALIRPEFTPEQVYLIIIVILSILGWAGAARVIRGMSLSLRNRQFIYAAESLGQPAWKILILHILPNLSSYLLVAATLAIPGYILAEASLSFLGLGITEPSVSWGLMLKQANSDMKIFFMNYWWMLLPGFAILITVISFNVVGDVLRDVVDPKFRMNSN